MEFSMTKYRSLTSSAYTSILWVNGRSYTVALLTSRHAWPVKCAIQSYSYTCRILVTFNFYHAAWNADAVCPSVCLSVKRVYCGKTEETFVRIFYTIRKRLSACLSFCLSVCLSNVCIVTKTEERFVVFLYHAWHAGSWPYQVTQDGALERCMRHARPTSLLLYHTYWFFSSTPSLSVEFLAQVVCVTRSMGAYDATDCSVKTTADLYSLFTISPRAKIFVGVGSDSAVSWRSFLLVKRASFVYFCDIKRACLWVLLQRKTGAFVVLNRYVCGHFCGEIAGEIRIESGWIAGRKWAKCGQKTGDLRCVCGTFAAQNGRVCDAFGVHLRRKKEAYFGCICGIKLACLRRKKGNFVCITANVSRVLVYLHRAIFKLFFP